MTKKMIIYYNDNTKDSLCGVLSIKAYQLDWDQVELILDEIERIEFEEEQEDDR